MKLWLKNIMIRKKVLFPGKQVGKIIWIRMPNYDRTTFIIKTNTKSPSIIILLPPNGKSQLLVFYTVKTMTVPTYLIIETLFLLWYFIMSNFIGKQSPIKGSLCLRLHFCVSEFHTFLIANYGMIKTKLW